MYGNGKRTDSGACHGEALSSLFFLCALASVVCMTGPQPKVAFFLTAAESEQIPSWCTCRSLQIVQHETIKYHNKWSPTVPYLKCSLRYALKGWEEKFHAHALSAGGQITTSLAAHAREWSGDLHFGLGHETLNLLVENLQVAARQLRNPPVYFQRELWPRRMLLLGSMQAGDRINWPLTQEMFTFFLEMLAIMMVVSESSFGAYAYHRTPAGLHLHQRLLSNLPFLCHGNRTSHSSEVQTIKIPIRLRKVTTHFPPELCNVKNSWM